MDLARGRPRLAAPPGTPRPHRTLHHPHDVCQMAPSLPPGEDALLPHRFQERAAGRPEGVSAMRERTEAEETPPVPTQGLDPGAGPVASSAATWWGPGGAQLLTGVDAGL